MCIHLIQLAAFINAQKASTSKAIAVVTRIVARFGARPGAKQIERHTVAVSVDRQPQVLFEILVSSAAGRTLEWVALLGWMR